MSVKFRLWNSQMAPRNDTSVRFGRQGTRNKLRASSLLLSVFLMLLKNGMRIRYFDRPSCFKNITI